MINAKSGISPENLIADIYQALLNPCHWRKFLLKLRRHLACDAIAISLRHSGSRAIGYAAWDRTHSLDNGLSKSTHECCTSSSPNPLDRALQSSGDTLMLDKVITNGSMHPSAVHLGLMKHLDCDYRLAMHVVEPNGWECRLGIMSSAQKIQLGIPEKLYLLSLRPDMECALKIYSRIKCGPSWLRPLITRPAVVFQQQLDRIGN